MDSQNGRLTAAKWNSVGELPSINPYPHASLVTLLRRFNYLNIGFVSSGEVLSKINETFGQADTRSMVPQDTTDSPEQCA